MWNIAILEQIISLNAWRIEARWRSAVMAEYFITFRCSLISGQSSKLPQGLPGVKFLLVIKDEN
jgi:hypothetical protein